MRHPRLMPHSSLLLCMLMLSWPDSASAQTFTYRGVVRSYGSFCACWMIYLEPDSGFDGVNLASIPIDFIGRHVQVSGEIQSCLDPECPPGTVVLVPSRIDSLRTLEVFHSAGWNMVSLPLLPSDIRSPSVFTHASSPPFAYHHGYVGEDSLKPGRGYWLKSSDSTTYSITAIPLEIETVAVEQGWNIVGSISVPVPVSEILATDSSMTLSYFYIYVPALGTYVTADPIQPGSAYWVKANKAGAVILKNPGTSVQTK